MNKDFIPYEQALELKELVAIVIQIQTSYLPKQFYTNKPSVGLGRSIATTALLYLPKQVSGSTSERTYLTLKMTLNQNLPPNLKPTKKQNLLA